MDALKRTRRPVRKQVTTLVSEIEKLLKEPSVDQDLVEAKFRLLVDSNTNLQNLDLKITDQLVEDNASEEDQDAEFRQIQEYQQKAELTRIKVEKLNIACQLRSPEGSIAQASQASTVRRFKLPEVQLKKFSGELKDWLGYWAQFEKIHEDESLHGSDKFHYLIQSMEPGTDAYEMVSSYPQSSENYYKVVEALKDRFGSKDLLLQVYIRELLKLVISNVNSKVKIPFQSLYLKLDSHLRALKTLDLEKADPATWLFPLVESSLPEEILLAWQRSPLSTQDGSLVDPPRTRLDNLMEFLGKEVDIRQKINLARSTFHEESQLKREAIPVKKIPQKEKFPTLMGCHSGEITGCIFCGKNHESSDCFKARKMPLEEKSKVVREKRVCFKCLRPNHIAKKCRARLRCMLCGRSHAEIMCTGKEAEKERKDVKPGEVNSADNIQTVTGVVAIPCTGKVALQLMIGIICSGSNKKKIRIFLDPGCQRSYILKTTAMELELKPTGEETVIHSLFGAVKTAAVRHGKYTVSLQHPNNNYNCTFQVRDQWKITNPVPQISPSTTEGRSLLEELKKNQIEITDVGDDNPEIEMLIGGDVYGRLLTGKVVQLTNGITAIETKLGWVLMGEVNGEFGESVSMSVMDMVVADSSITQLWDLDTIGIRDDIQVKTATQEDEEIKARFKETISRNPDGRYVVSLPWKDGHPQLPLNKDIATKKLMRVSDDLQQRGLFQKYGDIFRQWEQAGIIERVPQTVKARIFITRHTDRY